MAGSPISGFENENFAGPLCTVPDGGSIDNSLRNFDNGFLFIAKFTLQLANDGCRHLAMFTLVPARRRPPSGGHRIFA